MPAPPVPDRRKKIEQSWPIDCSSQGRHSSPQFPHVGNDQRRAARLQAGCVLRSAMASAAEADRRHAGGDGGIDPCRAVLDNQTVLRRGREPLRSIKEQIGRRLAARHHRRAEDVRVKAIEEADER